MNTQTTPPTISEKWKRWLATITETAPVELEPIVPKPIAKPRLVLDASSLNALQASITAVSGKLLHADNLADTHTHLFNIFCDIDASRMVIADDPVLANLELSRRWPNMECCTIGQEKDRFCRDPIDVHLHHLCLSKHTLATQSILLAPTTALKQLAQLNGRSPERLIIILYGES